MNKKLLFQFVGVAVILILIGIAINGHIAQANFFTDLLNKIPFLKSSQPTEKIVERIIEKAVPYESGDTYEQSVIKAVETAAPSVVSIIVSKDLPIIEQCPYDPFGDIPLEFRQFFGGGSGLTVPCQKGTKKQEVGGGSGFIISADGLILTNKHVVSDTSASYTVLTNDGKKYDAKVLARDPVQDLAVVKIDAIGLKPVTLGNSDTIKLGQTAIAIGNALGEFRNTVSTGVVSGLARSIIASDSSGGGSETLEGLIQTDAAINPGNSGGPLLNLKGEVIGVNTAIVSGAQSIGFAIPINKAKRDIISVKTSGKILVPFLGVRYLVINDSLIAKEKLNVKYGALVRGDNSGPAVVKDSPAFKAGVQAEDIILEVGGQKIEENNSLGSVIQKYQVGDNVKLKIFREGKEIELKVVLEERKD